MFYCLEMKLLNELKKHLTGNIFILLTMNNFSKNIVYRKKNFILFTILKKSYYMFLSLVFQKPLKGANMLKQFVVSDYLI